MSPQNIKEEKGLDSPKEENNQSDLLFLDTAFYLLRILTWANTIADNFRLQGNQRIGKNEPGLSKEEILTCLIKLGREISEEELEKILNVISINGFIGKITKYKDMERKEIESELYYSLIESMNTILKFRKSNKVT